MASIITPLAIPDVLLIRPARHGDARGWFSEIFNAVELAAHGVDFHPMQENLAFSAEANIVRGLHAQAPPSAQAKLVRAARGRIFDVAVDARAGSPTFGQWAGVELSAETGDQVFVPAGFLHGYATREPDCEVVYLVDAPYDKAREIRVRWNDPGLGIGWGLTPEAATLSNADRGAALWANFKTPFSFRP